MFQFVTLLNLVFGFPYKDIYILKNKLHVTFRNFYVHKILKPRYPSNTFKKFF